MKLTPRLTVLPTSPPLLMLVTVFSRPLGLGVAKAGPFVAGLFVHLTPDAAGMLLSSR